MRGAFVVAAAVLMVGMAAPASAQPRVEASVFGGWTFSDGVSGDAVRADDGNIYDEVDVEDGGSWGLTLGANVTDAIEVGFLFGQQLSTLRVRGTADTEVGDLTINTYHPYVAFNVGDADSPLRPYLLVGLGATNYGSVAFTRPNGAAGETSSETQFSSTWGGGLKLFPSPNVGVRVGVQFTPTYIKSDAVGWWCDPFWGCYVVADSQYSNQFQLNGGIAFRF